LCLATSKTCWNVPFERNLGFVGREAQFERLESILFAEGQPSNVTITGLGGVGKTQVVLELAYRVRMRFPACSVLWLPASSAEHLQQAYVDAGRQLGISSMEDKGADVKKLAQRHLNQESAGQWLLIFDNADDIDIWIKDKRRWVPSTQGLSTDKQPRPHNIHNAEQEDRSQACAAKCDQGLGDG